MSLGLLSAGLLSVMPITAPCSMPAALQERVCADADLARLDATLAAREQAVLKVTARPATWTGRAASFRSNLATERDGDGALLGKAELIARFEDHIHALESEIATAATIRPGATRVAILGSACLSRWLTMGCTVPAAGVVRDGGLTILYQIMTGSSEDYGISAGVMLWDASGPGVPKLIGWTFEGVEMRTPKLNAERGLLWVPGTTSGTGVGNADILYQKRGGRWVEIDMENWQDALGGRLPPGIGAWHGVAYEFMGDAMGAETDLWQQSDANCCPTAGHANLGFVIEGDRLKLDTVSAQIGGPKEEWKDF